MLFDLMCTIIEREPQVSKVIPRHVIEDAKLFAISGKLPEVQSTEDSPAIFPYDHIAYESQVLAGDLRVQANFCIFISKGCNVGDKFNAVLKEHNQSYHIEKTILIISSFPNPHQGMQIQTTIEMGIMGYPEDADSISSTLIWGGDVVDKNIRNIAFGADDREKPDFKKHESWFYELLNHAMDITTVLCEPRLHIIKEMPLKQINARKKILRSHERPRYTILDINQVQTRYNLGRVPGESGITKCAHFRRAHKRLLSSDRYVNMQGKYVKVKHTWIGPSECTIRNKRYEVILDPDLDT